MFIIFSNDLKFELNNLINGDLMIVYLYYLYVVDNKYFKINFLEIFKIEKYYE